MSLHKKFLIGLEKIELNPEHVKLWEGFKNKKYDDFIFKYPHIKYALNDKINSIHSLSLDEFKTETKCICSHSIYKVCIITNGEECLLIGNCCINQFIEKKCINCGDEYKQRRDNNCNKCRKQLKKEKKEKEKLRLKEAFNKHIQMREEQKKTIIDNDHDTSVSMDYDFITGKVMTRDELNMRTINIEWENGREEREKKEEIQKLRVKEEYDKYIELVKQQKREKYKKYNIYLTVPYSQKDEVKALGAWYDGDSKKWFITKNHDNELFQKWL